MHEVDTPLGPWRTVVVRSDAPPKVTFALLHGYAMGPDDFSPFAKSLGGEVHFFFPEAPLRAEVRGACFWPIDQERRAAALVHGPRDLALERPEGAPRARAELAEWLAAVRRVAGPAPLVLGGFSQGGMLVADALFRGDVEVAALVLLSSSRIFASDWARVAERAKGLPVLVSHGRADDDLAFAAGEALRDLFVAGGAEVTWVPHDGGHQVPLVVWRALRKFLGRVVAA